MVPHPPPRGLRRGGAPGLQRPGLPPARAPRRRPGPAPGPRPRAAADRGGDAAPSPTSPEGLRALAHSSLKRQNVPGLKARAKALGIKGISKMKKAGVIEALLDFGDLDPSETPEQVLARVRAGAPVNPAAATLDGDQVARRLRELAEKDIFALREVASQYGLMGVTRMLKREIVSHVMTLEFGPASAGAVKAFYDTELEPEFREEDLEIPDDPTQLAAWNTYQLRAAARAQGIPQATQLRKSELIAALSGAKGAAPPAAGEFAFLEGLEAEGADAANRPGPDVDPLSSDLFQMDDALDAWASQDFLSQVGGGPPSTLQTTLTVGLVCGGASAERGISLNTARSVLDHLQSDAVEVRVFYVAGGGDRAYAVEGAQLYSNTPSDFDYALRAQESLTLEELAAELAATVDLAFPVIHGAFGEGGGLQALLEAAGVPFVGSDAEAARAAFHKARGAARIAAAGLPTVPLVALTAEDLDGDAAAAEAKLAAFFAARGLDPAAGAAVVKPASGGSSVGVTPTAGAAAALAAARDLVQARGLDAEVVVEPYVRGREFTVNVLETANGPVALMPSEVEFVAGDATGNPGLRCFWEEEEEGGGKGGERDAAGGDGDALPIYDYRKKYLPTSQSRTHTPGRFSDGILKHIRASAERLFAELGLRDFARFDGWFVDEREAARLLDAPAPVLFTEVNIISGMEQNSFVFQQAANASLTHQALLLNIVQSACARHGLALNARGLHVPPVMLPLSAGGETTRALQYDAENEEDPNDRNLKVFILCGGPSSERHVSLMSATNAFLKLRKYRDLTPHVFLLDCGNANEDVYFRTHARNRHDAALMMEFGCREEDLPPNVRAAADAPLNDPRPLLEENVFEVPYFELLHHTADEVRAACYANCCDLATEEEEAAEYGDESLAWAEWTRRTPTSYWQAYENPPPQEALWQALRDAEVVGFGSAWGPRPRARPPFSVVGDLRRFIENARVCGAVVFNAVHGGAGEDGRLQELLANEGVCYTGSNPEASRVCADKVVTGQFLGALAAEGVSAAPKYELGYWDLVAMAAEAPAAAWREVTEVLGAQALCMKPKADGCSSGVAKLTCAEDLRLYARAAEARALVVPAGTFAAPHGEIAMPLWPSDFLLEPFVETAAVRVERGDDGAERVVCGGGSPWLETTVAVLGTAGDMGALTPSVTVKELGDVLTLEEKFQGGTGINLTPPPPEVVSAAVLATIRGRVELIANELQLEGFARVDAFVHRETGEVKVIEVNTVPGMTPSTVLFHQALAEDPPLAPEQFFRKAVDLALQGHPPAPLHEYEAQYWAGREYYVNAGEKPSDPVPTGWIAFDNPVKPSVLDHPEFGRKIRVSHRRII